MSGQVAAAPVPAIERRAERGPPPAAAPAGGPSASAPEASALRSAPPSTGAESPPALPRPNEAGPPAPAGAGSSSSPLLLLLLSGALAALIALRPPDLLRRWRGPPVARPALAIPLVSERPG